MLWATVIGDIAGIFLGLWIWWRIIVWFCRQGVILDCVSNEHGWRYKNAPRNIQWSDLLQQEWVCSGCGLASPTFSHPKYGMPKPPKDWEVQNLEMNPDTKEISQVMYCKRCQYKTPRLISRP